MKDSESLHKKVQEMCDCYANNDPLREMSLVKDDVDYEDAAVKWLALAALHGINGNARKLTIRRAKDGDVSVTAEYRGSRIFDAVRAITYIDGDRGKSDLALGVKDSSIALKVKVKRKKGGEKVTIKFPE